MNQARQNRIARTVFLFGGYLIALILGLEVTLWTSMRFATPVPVTITELKYTTHHSAGGGGKSPGGRTTYEVSAIYSYDFQNRSYTNHRTSVHFGSDNLGPFQFNLYMRLKQAAESGKEIRAYVVPWRPSLSTLDRTLRPSRVLLEGGLSAALLWFAFYIKRKTKCGEPPPSPYSSPVADSESGEA